MADRILLNSENKIWKNTNDIIIKDRPFNESVLQDGLEFWGRADVNLLTLVDGYISEAYDVRDGYGGARKMVQSDVSLRPTISNNYMIFTGWKRLETLYTSMARSVFIVLKALTISTNSAGLGYYDNGISQRFQIGLSYSNVYGYTVGGSSQTSANRYYYFDTIKRNYSSPVNANIHILHSLENFYRNTTYRVGAVSNSIINGNLYIYEWGWYNRVLNESESFYNVNALNSIYKIF